MDDFKNANNRTMNAYLNAICMYKYSYFANAVCFATEEPVLPIASLKFNKETDSIVAGDDGNYIVVPTPLNATTPTTITYTSSDTDVATVEADSDNAFGCVVTGVSAGTAVITATAGNVSTNMIVTVTSAS